MFDYKGFIMSKFLEVGKYYHANMNDIEIGDYQLPFYVSELNVYPLDSDEEFEKIENDEPYRDDRGVFNNKKYDYDYSLLFCVEDADESEAINDFILIEDEVEIEKAKIAIKEFSDYMSDMADKWEAQNC